MSAKWVNLKFSNINDNYNFELSFSLQFAYFLAVFFLVFEIILKEQDPLTKHLSVLIQIFGKIDKCQGFFLTLDLT